jgi:butyryl-CoA dehydrogenase
VSRVSAAIGLCLSVHNSVALYPILAFGSAEQHRRWVPPLARGEKIGAFCLTEPNAGSDAGGISATALPDEGTGSSMPTRFSSPTAALPTSA